MTDDTAEKKDAKGWKQLKALELINNHPEGGTFQELTSLVAQACFPETYTEGWISEVVRSKHTPDTDEVFIQNRAARLREGKARHLVRYMYKYQDEVDTQSGKKETLRKQGRIILPGKEKIIMESMSAVKDPETGKTRVGNSKPKRSTPVKAPEGSRAPTPMTEDRLAMFRKAAANVKASNTAKAVKELAEAGAHRIMGGSTVIKKEQAPAADTSKSAEAV